MVKNTKQLIETKLESLEGLDGVAVELKTNSIKIAHKKEHAIGFKFKWLQDDHFVGYFIDKHETESQAVVSIRSDKDATKFVKAFHILADLRANKKKNS